MKLLVLLTILFVAFFVKALTGELGALGRLLNWSLEGVSISLLVLFFIKIARESEFAFPVKYIALLSIYILFLLCGAFANDVQAGAVFAGIRNNLKFIPFFLVAFIFFPTKAEIYVAFKFILAIALIQVPLALYQWYFGPKGKTMDHVMGTLEISSYLSIFMIGCVVVLWANYLCGNVKPKVFFICTLVLLLPTTVNETKGTFFLLPLGFLVPALLFSFLKGNLKLALVALLGGAAFTAFFGVATTVLLGDSLKYNLFDFVFKGDFIDYLYLNADENSYMSWGLFNSVGRIDSIMFAIKYISKDAVTLMFGYGIGNVANSFSEITIGRYEEFWHLGPQITTVSIILWETGVIGLAIVIAGLVFIFRDAVRLARSDDYRALGLGMVGLVAVYTLVLPYKNIFISDANCVLFWAFSGLVAFLLNRRSIVAPVQNLKIPTSSID